MLEILGYLIIANVITKTKTKETAAADGNTLTPEVKAFAVKAVDEAIVKLTKLRQELVA